MAVRNYYFGIRNDNDSISGLVDYRSAELGSFNLSGNSYNDDRFSEGGYIVTSPVVNVSDSSATTHSGTVYSISDMHPDYQNFLDAIDKNIPILTNWVIKGNLRHGYRITGNIDEKTVTFNILNQDDGNILKVKNDNDTEFSIFVDWTSTNDVYATVLHLPETDLYFNKDFKNFCEEINCKPILFPK